MVNRLFFYAAPTELGLNLSAEVYTQVAPNGSTYLHGCLQLCRHQSIYDS
jgi:hypothetical protein